MKKSVKGILGVILAGVFIVMFGEIVSLNKEIETLEKANSYQKHKYEQLQTEFEEYKEVAEERVYNSFINKMFNGD